MDAHALAVLEFAEVRRILLDGVASALGREVVESLEPSNDLERIRLWQRHASEVRRIADQGHDIPLGGLHDLRGLVQQVTIGAVVDGPDLLRVAETLRCIERLRHFFAARTDTPLLAELAGQLVSLPALADELERCLTAEGEVADSASPELRRVRQAVRQLGQRVQTAVQRILSDLAGSDAVQDAVVTIRQGRYCVPIKASHQSHFAGLIHDRSASGQTVFMEPAEIVKLNNELREAELRERDEVRRILNDLCRQVAATADDLRHNLGLLTVLDVARARGRLSVRWSAVEPELDTAGQWELRRARHPLLVEQKGQAVVPLDLELGGAFNLVLVTGPNTGGKTVALKTIGLLTLIARAGLHIPADEGSRIAVGGEVYADIGDEQSLEQSLSTFGAHLKQLVAVLRHAQANDLVLLDEVGAGTDPTEGAALAEALLSALQQRGCRLVATTHHGSLKHYAYLTEGVENASVEFDARTLAPTFRLLVGIPGASHAFDIAARYGLPAEVLDAARRLLPQEHVEASEVIGRMQASRRKLDQEVEAAEHEAAIASHSRRELEKERRRLRELEIEIRATATRDAARLLEQTQAEAERILTALRGAHAEGKVTEEARRRLRALRDEVRSPSPPQAPRRPAAVDIKLNLGDKVEVLRLGCEGRIVALVADGRIEVQAGAMRMTVGPDEVALVSRTKPPPAPSGRRDLGQAASADFELHIRGETVDEAMIKVERYLDHALLSSLPEVRIVHGKGTGTLKRVVQEYLKHHPYVKSFRHPPENQGGTGVTVATLDL